MKFVALLFVALVVGWLSLSAYRSMVAGGVAPQRDTPVIDARKPAAGLKLDAFGPEAAEAATRARMERGQ